MVSVIKLCATSGNRAKAYHLPTYQVQVGRIRREGEAKAVLLACLYNFGNMVSGNKVWSKAYQAYQCGSDLGKRLLPSGFRVPCRLLRIVHAPLVVTTALAWKALTSHTFCTACESCWGAYEQRHTPGRGTIGVMTARDPFQLDKDQTDRSTEYGFGAGKYPDPRFDYSGGGSISHIPIADPDRDEQHLELAMIRRTDVSNPADQPSPYVMGNTDRFGAQPPLVRETKPPKNPRRVYPPPLRMQRQW